MATHPESAPALGSGARWGDRLVAGVFFFGPAAVLVLAAWLHPDASGMGTHHQLGLPPCGFLLLTGVPCLTCGMTTAFAYAAHGNLPAAFVAQPAGAIMAIMAACSVLISGCALVRDLSILPVLARLGRPDFMLTMAALMLAAWGYKIVVVLHHAA